ncbi:MAG: Smr/MutS family protein [Chloroflexi bacterium]|nr:Smr/MutS family protein [Chloroflexota bacterium]
MPKSRGQKQPRRTLLEQVSVPTEVHLRRMKVRDALEKLDRYLNDAALMGMPWVRVIHGKGTGVLKGAVLDFLDSHPLVARHYPAAPSEGNGGVTIAELK